MEIEPGPPPDQWKESGIRSAVFVDGKMRFLNEDGQPGDVVSGTFNFERRGNVYILFPKEEPIAVPKSPPMALEDESTEDHPVQQRRLSQLDDSELTAEVRSILQKLSIPGGTMLSDIAGPTFEEEDSNQQAESFDIEFYKSILRTGRIPKDEYIAVDAYGKFDVDHNNPGPELSSEGQITNSAYLSTINHEELATKRRKARKRMLAMLPLQETDEFDDLWAEREMLSRSSSISSVSAVSDAGEPSLDYPICGSDCWLKQKIIQRPAMNTVIPALSEPSETSAHSKRIYSQLEYAYTRIIRLEPASPDHPLVCSLEPIMIPSGDSPTSMIRNTRPYEALSYTWGCQENKIPILCNDIQFDVSKNLYEALLHLRLLDTPRYLWIDAISINQDDIAERNEQVRYMLEIYKGASSVVVWLGNASDESANAVQFMEFMDDYTNRRSILQRSHDQKCLQRLHLIYKAQIALFKRPWFRRSWIRQEVVAAKRVTVMCGQSLIPWHTMKRAANRLARIHRKLDLESDLDLESFEEDCIEPLQYLVQGWVFGQPTISSGAEIRSVWYYHAGGLLDLLMIGRGFEATDARDKIYSVLGMARVPIAGTTSPTHLSLAKKGKSSDDQVENMEIDYSKSVSVVYQNLAKFFINRDRNLDILCILLTHRDINSSIDLPSWTPDWRASTQEAGIMDCWDFFASKFGAAGFTQAERQNLEDVGTLTVKGFALDVVESLMDFTTWVPRGKAEPYSEVLPFDKSKHLRRLGRLSGGQTCLVPRDTQPGDYVFILHGGKLPFVLRPCMYADNSEEGHLPEDSILEENSDHDRKGLEKPIEGDDVERGGEGNCDDCKQQVAQTQENRNETELESRSKHESKVEQNAVLSERDEEVVFQVLGPCWVPGMVHGAAIKMFQENPNAVLSTLTLI